jgi:sodium/potassium-transporting ATPase subunit alpha
MRGVVDSNEKNYLENPSIGLAGTHCVSGSAMGIVVGTGDGSIFGRVSVNLFHFLLVADYNTNNSLLS